MDVLKVKLYHTSKASQLLSHAKTKGLYAVICLIQFTHKTQAEDKIQNKK